MRLRLGLGLRVLALVAVTGAGSWGQQDWVRQIMNKPVVDVREIQFAGGAKGDGANDDGPAINAAIRYIQQNGNGTCLFMPAGTYYTTVTITIDALNYGPMCLIGAGYVVDYATAAWHDVTNITSTANPIIQISPYPGVTIEGVHFEGRGTSTCVETYDVANYCRQIGIWAGNIYKPLRSNVTTPADMIPCSGPGSGPECGGSGGLMLSYVSISGQNGGDQLGKSFYGYKLWGTSSYSNVEMWGCGKITVGDPDTDNATCIEYTSDSVDQYWYGGHLISGTGGTGGTAVKIGTSGAKTAPLGRTYTYAAHIDFTDMLVEGAGEYVYRQYACSDCKIIGGQWSGEHDHLTVGETPSVNYRANNHFSAVAVGTFHLGDVELINTTTTQVNFIQEGEGTSTVLPIKYWMSGHTITGKNVKLVPMFTKARLDLNDPDDEEWVNTPAAITDGQPPDTVRNLAPSYYSWTLTNTSGLGKIVGPSVVQLAEDDEIVTTLSLKPDTLYTMVFTINTIFGSSLLSNRYVVLDASDNVLLDNGWANTSVSGVNQIARLIQFRTPAPDGTIKLKYSSSDPNFGWFLLPLVVEGAHYQLNYNNTTISAADNLSMHLGKYAFDPVSGQQYFSITKVMNGFAPAACADVNGCWWKVNPFGTDETTPLLNATSQEFNLFPVNGSNYVSQVVVKTDTSFSGIGLSSVELNVGTTDNTSFYLSGYELLTAVAANNFALGTAVGPQLFSPQYVSVEVVATGNNLPAIIDNVGFSVWLRVDQLR